MIEPWSLTKRVEMSTLVLEGTVIDQYGKWDAQHQNIYTISTVAIFKIFKGNVANDTIKLITEGGSVGSDMLKVSPSLELHLDDVGVLCWYQIK
jgi:hypothetical protein